MFATDGVDEIFDDAHTVVSVRSRTGRQNALPLETRGCIAYWDDRDEQVDHLHLYAGSAPGSYRHRAVSGSTSARCASSYPTWAAASGRSASSDARRSPSPQLR